MRIQNFNPRSREGSDTEEDGFAYSFALFQSTLPRGERPNADTVYILGDIGFQSTLPRGERLDFFV